LRVTGKTRRAAVGRGTVAVSVSLLAAGAASAHEGHTELIEELVVYGRAQQLLGAADAASEGMVGYDDLELPPLLRVGELAESVPGMVATQHSGTGKANQYFLRGFNLDHGTDFSAFVDGVPVNLRTHGHGQGYLDLNFLIPELVEAASYRKGTYAAEVGDFSSAGTVHFAQRRALDEELVSLTLGSFDYGRALAAGSFGLGDGTLVAAADHTRYAGPWDLDEDLDQTRLHAAFTRPWRDGEARLSFSGYSGDWASTDQVPKRAVDAGLIDRLGYIDPDLGGSSSRYAVTGSTEFEDWRALAYVIDYDLSLYSDFTYFLDDPLNGDEFEQRDSRTVYGLRLDGERAFPGAARPVILRWGVDARVDDIDEVGLYRTAARERMATVRRDSVRESSVSAYGELGFIVTDSLRATAGLRADGFDWDVDAMRPVNSGSGNDVIVSPKLNLAWRVTERVEAYANWGRGFHSNDVRGTTISIDPASGEPVDPVEALAASDGAEIGLRYEAGERFNLTATAFWLELDSELVFVGDAGTTEPNAGSRRQGIEITSFWQATDWLAAHATFTTTNSEFLVDEGEGREIPGAIPASAVIGLNGAWENGAFASLRFRYLASAPLVEDGSVESGSSTLVNAGVGYRWRRYEVRLDAFNLLDSTDSDISYWFASRLEGEPATGVEDVHYHPLEPRSVRATITVHW